MANRHDASFERESCASLMDARRQSRRVMKETTMTSMHGMHAYFPFVLPLCIILFC